MDDRANGLSRRSRRSLSAASCCRRDQRVLNSFIASVGIAGVLVAAQRLPAWRRRPDWASVVSLLPATAAIGMLIFSAGTITGLTALLLLPVFFSALYGRPWESLVVIPAVAITLAILGVSANDTLVVLMRLLVFWVSLMAMVSITTHLLRARLVASIAGAEEEARQTAVIAQATRILTSIRDPELVVRAAAQLANEISSPPNASGRRAQYFHVVGDRASLVADSDDIGASVVGEVIPLAEHPIMADVVASGTPMNREIDISACGPQLQRLLTMLQITHAAYVPVLLDGSIHGVLVASGVAKPFRVPSLSASRRLAISLSWHSQMLQHIAGSRKRRARMASPALPTVASLNAPFRGSRSADPTPSSLLISTASRLSMTSSVTPQETR